MEGYDSEALGDDPHEFDSWRLLYDAKAALEILMVERAVVEAQALEQAARFLRERNWAWNHTDGAMEAARAVELLAIDKSEERQ